MKEIRETKLVEQTTIKFVANDGKEFIGENAESDCRNYERKSNDLMVQKEFEKLGAKQIEVPVLLFFMDYAEVWQVPLTSTRDYIAMKDYFEAIENCYDNYTKEPEEYPYTMTVIKGYDWYDEYMTDLKLDLQKALDQLN